MDDRYYRIGWLKLSPAKLAEILRGKAHYKELADAEDLEVLDVKIVGVDVVPIVMVAIRTNCLDLVDRESLIAPTISMNPERA